MEGEKERGMERKWGKKMGEIVYLVEKGVRKKRWAEGNCPNYPFCLQFLLDIPLLHNFRDMIHRCDWSSLRCPYHLNLSSNLPNFTPQNGWIDECIGQKARVALLHTAIWCLSSFLARDWSLLDSVGLLDLRELQRMPLEVAIELVKMQEKSSTICFWKPLKDEDEWLFHFSTSNPLPSIASTWFLV